MERISEKEKVSNSDIVRFKITTVGSEYETYIIETKTETETGTIPPNGYIQGELLTTCEPGQIIFYTDKLRLSTLLPSC